MFNISLSIGCLLFYCPCRSTVYFYVPALPKPLATPCQIFYICHCQYDTVPGIDQCTSISAMISSAIWLKKNLNLNRCLLIIWFTLFWTSFVATSESFCTSSFLLVFVCFSVLGPTCFSLIQSILILILNYINIIFDIWLPWRFAKTWVS